MMLNDRDNTFLDVHETVRDEFLLIIEKKILKKIKGYINQVEDEKIGEGKQCYKLTSAAKASRCHRNNLLRTRLVWYIFTCYSYTL